MRWRRSCKSSPDGSAAAGDGGLGQVIVFVGSRGGVGTTTTAVGCAWLLAEERAEPTALLDLDLHFGTVALKLDTEPGSGLYEALEQPSRIDSLFIDRAMVKVTDNLRVLATEASAAQHLMIDAGAIDMLLYELRRKFPRVVVDLPRGATPVQRVMLAAASHVVMLCERSLAGLRDTIRLQTLMREQAPQVRLWLVEAGASGSRALIGKSEFEKGVGKAFDMTLSFDPKAAGAAANTGQPLPVAAPRSPVVREFRRLAEIVAGPATRAPKRRMFAIALAMVGYFKRPEGENALDARIAGLSQRRALTAPVAAPPRLALAPAPVIELPARCLSRRSSAEGAGGGVGAPQ